MKVLASDFDNTLYVSDDKVFKNNVLAINEFIKKGNIFCIITGRNYSDIKLLLNKYNISYSYLICQDGAKIFNNVDFCIRSILLDEEKISNVCQILDDNNYDYFLDDGYNNTTNVYDCVKIVAHYKDKEKAVKLINEIKKKVDVYAYISSQHINIISSGVNKSSSLNWLIKNEKLSKYDIYVIGDDINDLEMLSEFRGAIMKIHNSELDNLSKNEYDTLYEYIEELCKN